jgi:transcription initiation factor TFIID subunit 12
MNNGQQGGQPASGQGQPFNPQQQQQQPQQGNPQQQQQRKINIFRPEQMRSLPEQFSAEEKVKWENGLRQLWAQMEKNPPDSQSHRDAKKKLFDFSKTLTMKLQAGRQQAQAAQQAQQAQAQAQQGQEGAAGVARLPSQGQPPQPQPGESSSQANPAQQARPKPQISQKLIDHVNAFPYVPPTSLAAGSPEAMRWIQEMKGKYLKALTAMEGASVRVLQMKEHYDKMIEEGKQFSPEEEKEFKDKQEIAKKSHADYKNFVDNFRRQQEAARTAANNANQANAGPQGGQTAGGNPANGNVQAPPARPQMNVNQAANPALQNTQIVNTAIEAARNQQMGGGRPPVQNGQAPQQGMGMPSQGNPSLPPQQQMPNIKTEQGAPPQINTAITQMQRGQGGSGMTASPQSAVPRSAGIPQSATSQAPQIPQALSQSDALHQAARSYSNPGPANVMGHSHPNPSVPRDANVMTNKMPIPKQLPERAIAPPQPVEMPRARPTATGGANNLNNGVMSHPVIPKAPGYSVEGGAEGVLSRKKLDELVRQVTGGGDGLEGGQGLTPEVEEVCFLLLSSLADSSSSPFLDSALIMGYVSTWNSGVLDITFLPLVFDLCLPPL